MKGESINIGRSFERDVRRNGRIDGVRKYSTGVAVISGGRVLVVRRSADDFLGGYYELPGGGVEPGESFVDAACRELEEETGLKVRAIRQVAVGFDYWTSNNVRTRQVNVVAEVEPGAVSLSAEHDEMKWVGPGDVDTLRMSEDMRASISKLW